MSRREGGRDWRWERGEGERRARKEGGGGGVGRRGGGVVEGRGGRRAWEIEGQCGGEG